MNVTRSGSVNDQEDVACFLQSTFPYSYSLWNVGPQNSTVQESQNSPFHHFCDTWTRA